ncbi:hypothetical protein [Haladaptatus sp. DYSN1]|uniref:hypothetical protein n=1 Tax=unclassified Haladaptatus TaxID=2622732 RepID=UPI002405FE81|nr:hypothetical protein [Haladaptatus sp. DYSN1]
MYRRKFLFGVVAATALTGCTDFRNGSANEQTTAYIDDPNQSIEFDVLNHDCLAEDTNLESANEVEFTHDSSANRIRITGNITDGEPQKTAYLQNVNRVTENNELLLTVFTKEAEDLEECPSRTQYRIQIT